MRARVKPHLKPVRKPIRKVGDATLLEGFSIIEIWQMFCGELWAPLPSSASSFVTGIKDLKLSKADKDVTGPTPPNNCTCHVPSTSRFLPLNCKLHGDINTWVLPNKCTTFPRSTQIPIIPAAIDFITTFSKSKKTKIANQFFFPNFAQTFYTISNFFLQKESLPAENPHTWVEKFIKMQTKRIQYKQRRRRAQSLILFSFLFQPR